jgi:hypothetical protein
VPEKSTSEEFKTIVVCRKVAKANSRYMVRHKKSIFKDKRLLKKDKGFVSCLEHSPNFSIK